MTLQGIGVSGGIAIGRIFIKEHSQQTIEKTLVIDVHKELAKFEEAKAKAILELKEIYQKVLVENGEEKASIFEAHQMMIEDLDYIEHIENLIKQDKVSAEYAVSNAGEVFGAMFKNMDNDYMKEREADIKDISQRIIQLLGGEKSNLLSAINTPVIVVAKDLLPSDTIQMDKRYVLGFITEAGGKTSHAAILANAMGIPAVVGAKHILDIVRNEQTAALDGKDGQISLDLSSDELKVWERKQEYYNESVKDLLALKGTANVTKDGVHIGINANIASPHDIEMVIESEAEGIGLFRSEFLYMEAKELPSEDEQYEAYKKVLEAVKGKVIIRTLDVGGDKELPCLNLLKDENPFLGYRAIRVCLNQKDVFVTQLRALLRASVYGTLGIMFPMISTLEEIKEVKEILKEVKENLEKEQIPFSKDIEIGMMIETPAAVILSDLFAKEVQFFSIGTNDLTQYIMAADRMNAKVAYLYDTHNPAVLRAIKTVTENARHAGIWVGVCGEAAADTSLTPFFLNIGINELSVSSGSVLKVRQKVQQIDTRDIIKSI